MFERGEIIAERDITKARVAKKKDNGKKGMERIKESHGRKGSEGKKGWIADRDFIVVRNMENGGYEWQGAEGLKS
jgi:hypothetical protein